MSCPKIPRTSLRFLLCAALLPLTVVSFSPAGAQASGEEALTKGISPQTLNSPEKAALAAGQQAFAQMKMLAGSWEGLDTVHPLMPGMKGQPNHPTRITMRVTSRGNAIVHEMQEANTPLDPSKYDHPVTMLYVDAGQLNLVHYCDAGNRPSMTGTISPDGKSVEFAFASLSGSNVNGHMDHVVFTFIDENHHTEDWTYMFPGNKPIDAHFDLHRVN